GNGRRGIFHKEQDFEAFERILAEALEQVPTRLLCYCLMPNHWHLVLCPRADGELSRFVAWAANTHVKRYRIHYHDTAGGHLYQGRFRSFPVQDDCHLLTVLRYVEANPLRTKLAQRAGEWPSCSFAAREQNRGPLASRLAEWPVDCPADWAPIVERRWTEAESDT